MNDDTGLKKPTLNMNGPEQQISLLVYEGL